MSGWRIFLVLCILALLQLPCGAAEEESFFDKDDVVCHGIELTRGGCSVDRSDQLSCRFTSPPEKTSSAGLMYIVWHFTSAQEAAEQFQDKASEYRDVHETLLKGISGTRIDIHEYTSDNSRVILEHEQEWIGSGKPSYVLRYATRTGDTVVTQVNLIAYDSEQGFEADKVNVPACINDAIERKIPGITRTQGTPAAGGTFAGAAGSAEYSGGAPAGVTGSNPVPGFIGRVESMIADGLTPLGMELMDTLNLFFGALIDEKLVPSEVDDAIKKEGIDCNQWEKFERDNCYRDAALATGNPLICHKMFSGVRMCYEDVVLAVKNPVMCEKIPYTPKEEGYWGIYRDHCYEMVFRVLDNPFKCDDLPETRKADCFAVLAEKEKNWNLCLNIQDDCQKFSRCVGCVAVLTQNEELCEQIMDDRMNQECVNDIRNNAAKCRKPSKKLGDLLYGCGGKATGIGGTG